MRDDNRGLLNFHKPKDLLAVPIRKQKKRFQVPGHNNILREQFPLTLCYANTSHKGQGLTLDKVITDFSEAKRIFPGSFYTAMTRVRYGKNFYLRDFKPEYIVATPNVERVLDTMKISVPYTFKKVQLSDAIFKEPDDEIKIGYVNINALYTGMSDVFLNNDENLLHLDLLAVADTRLEEKDSTDELKERLSNWKILCRFDANDGQKHMGLLLLQSKLSTTLNTKGNNKTMECKKWTEEKQGKVTVFAQHIFFKFKDLEISFIYIKETPSMRDVQRINNTIQSANLIMGDLNLDPNRDNDYEKLAALTGNFQSRVLHEATFRWGNQLDHIILSKDLYPDHYCTSYTNHTTDHKSIAIRLPLGQNKFSESFKKEIHFQDNQWTKRVPKEKPVMFQIPLSFSDEEIVPKYLDLLNIVSPEKIVFRVSFYDEIKDMEFENISAKHRKYLPQDVKPGFIGLLQPQCCFTLSSHS